MATYPPNSPFNQKGTPVKEEITKIYIGVNDDGTEFIYSSNSGEDRRQRAIKAFLGITNEET